MKETIYCSSARKRLSGTILLDVGRFNVGTRDVNAEWRLGLDALNVIDLYLVECVITRYNGKYIRTLSGYYYFHQFHGFRLHLRFLIQILEERRKLLESSV